MRVLFLLFFISLIGVLAAFLIPAWSGVLLIAGPSALACVILLLYEALKKPKPQDADAAKWIVVDGSNVMYWRDQTPRIQTIQEVVDHLINLGFTPGVMFDANAGYLLGDQYFHDDAFCQLLGLPPDQVMVVPKGTPADPYILRAARDLGARVVTNDKFRDWIDDHPEVRKKGFLVKGSYRSGKLSLNLGKGVKYDVLPVN